MKGFVFSKKGTERNINEDFASFKIVETGQYALLAVADGMGELDYGNESSKLVVDSVIAFLEEKIGTFDGKQSLLDALNHADTLLDEFSRKNNCVSGVAIAVGVVVNDMLFFTWQGNVRIYHKDKSGWLQLTTDHKLPIGNGRYGLTRCLKGRGLRDDVPLRSNAVFPGNSILVCTDGLYEVPRCMEETVKIIESQALECQYSFKDDATGILIEI